MRVAVHAAVAIAGCAMLAGCQTPGLHTVPFGRDYSRLAPFSIAQAEAAVQQAQRAGAQVHAPHAWAQAEAYLREARAAGALDRRAQWDRARLAAQAATRALEASPAAGSAGVESAPETAQAARALFDETRERYRALPPEHAARYAPHGYAFVEVRLSRAEHALVTGRWRRALSPIAEALHALDALETQDTDADGVPDLADAAPWHAEDADGFEDADGAPDPDNEGDGVPDAVDAAPMQPETRNAWRDHDGAPDTPPALEPLYFAPGSVALTAGQRGYLRALAALARELSPGLTLHVAGHTDARHSERYSLALSERRARAVRDYLIESGMPAERVVAEGFGHQRPAEPNTTGANLAANRRVVITFR